MVVHAQCSLGMGVDVAFQPLDKNVAIRTANSTAIQTGVSYTRQEISCKSDVEGYLVVSLCKSDQSLFTDEEAAEYKDALFVSVIDYATSAVVDNIDNKIAEAFIAVFTEEVFNANNKTKQIEIPTFNFFDSSGNHRIEAQTIDYNWGTRQKKWFALVVSSDYSTVQMVDWDNNNVVMGTRLIAFLRRETISTTDIVEFYGGVENKFAINGQTIRTNVDDIKTEVSNIESIDDIDYGVLQHMNSSTVPNVNGNRVSLGFNVLAGLYIKVLSNDENSGIVVQVWDTWTNAVISPYTGIGKLQELTPSGYTSSADGFIESDGVLIIKFKKNDGDAITAEEKDAMLVGLQFSISSKIYSDIQNVQDNLDTINDKVDTINDKVDAVDAKVGDYSAITEITDISEAEYERRHTQSTSTESLTGSRYTFGFNVNIGDVIEVQTTYSPGIVVCTFSTFDNACIGAARNILQNFTPSSYTTSKVVGTCNVAGVLSIKFMKSDSSAITDEEMAEMKNSLTLKIVSYTAGSGISKEIENLKEIVNDLEKEEEIVAKNKKKLYIGNLEQGLTQGNSISVSNFAVSQKSAVAVPYYNVTVSIKLPNNYRIGFKTAYATSGVTLTWVNDSGWLENGSSYQFDDHNEQIYRCYFAKKDNSTITPEEVKDLIDNEKILLTYDSYDGTVVERNSHIEHYVKGLMRKHTGVRANDDSLHKMAVFTHLSDIHGDVTRYENFMQYSEFIEADAALVSGDMVPMSGRQDSTDYIDDVADKYNCMLLPCMGNHDARNNTTKQLQNVVLSHSIEKYSLNVPIGEEYPTYYYKDIEAHSIRIISLNLYCAGQQSTNLWRLTQEQITWFVGVLTQTPADYGVIIVMHSPETTTIKDIEYAKFYQHLENGAVTYNNPYFPIRKIVDAFIDKTVFSGTFDETISGGITETISINADFTSVPSSSEFICYVTGHRHKDCIGLVNGADNRQVMCNIGLGFSLYGDSHYHYYAEEVDVPRGGKGFVQDLFNVYVIDRATGNLRIARVGSNMNSEFEMRDYMIMPYK